MTEKEKKLAEMQDEWRTFISSNIFQFHVSVYNWKIIIKHKYCIYLVNETGEYPCYVKNEGIYVVGTLKTTNLNLFKNNVIRILKRKKGYEQYSPYPTNYNEKR